MLRLDRPGRVARAGAPVVVAAVPVLDGDRGRVDVLEAVEHHRDVVAAELLEVAAQEAADAAAAAEVALPGPAAPLVGGERLLAGEQPEVGRRHDGGGRPEAAADAAVALAAVGRVDLRLEPDRPAVTG